MEMNKKRVLEIIQEWEDVEYDIKHGMADSYRYDGDYEAEDHLERFFYDEIECGFCVITEKSTGETYLSETLEVYDDDMCGYVRYDINELRDYIKNGCEWKDYRR